MKNLIFSLSNQTNVMKKTVNQPWLQPTRILLLCMAVTTVSISYGQVSDKTFITPDKVQTTRLGTLQFK